VLFRFELDSDEEDFLCEDLCINRDTNESNAFTKLSKVSRPSMQTVIDALPSQKRKRPTQKEDKNEEKADEVEDEGNKETNLHKHELRTLARLGDQFSDDFLDSLLKKNLMGLQGLDESLSQSCWIPLPTSQRPIANWRFVLETLARTPASLTGSSLPLRLSTLENIKNRLFRLYANPHHLVQNQHLSRLVQAYQDSYDVNDSVNNVHSF
jgi:hypothetical protein